LLGIMAFVLYNGLYTPLKQTSVFALFPGGLAGALPPLIGWTAAGGMLADSRAWLLFTLFFLWQIPHFCIILLSHHEDYQAVEQPTLSRLFPKQSLTRITQVWILAFIVVALAFTLDGNQLETGARLTITLMAVILTIFCISLFFKKKPQNYRFMFFILNGSFFSTLLIVALLQLYAAW
jgi:protoheme IX farnesyltransferase